MSSRPRFGPAGIPPIFQGPSEDVPIYLHNMGLDALEYQAVRGVKITEAKAKLLGENAEKHDVLLSLHGPYYINLAGDMAVVEASKKRILDSLKAAKWMKASRVVFHPGYYGSKKPSEALNMCVKALQEVAAEAYQLGLGPVRLGPEISGKSFQLGSLDEIIEICRKVEQTDPTMDWSHIHARSLGKLRSEKDYMEILEKLERELGILVVKHLHCHFTRVEFTSKGERRHRILEEDNYGPDFEPLAKLIVELGLNPTVISETPLLDIDALKMKAAVDQLRLKAG